MRFLYLLFLYFGLCLFPTWGQFLPGPGWQELTITNGLSQGMIFDLKQDKKGFIWVATKDGLNRFDGYNFKIFSNDPYNPYSISDNACSALLIDRHERLWIGTLNKGLNLYDDRTQRFYHIVIRDKTLANGANYEIRMLTEDPDGNIWVGTSVGRPFKIQLPASLQQNFPDRADFTNQIQLTSVHITGKPADSPNIYFSFKPTGEAIAGLDNGIYAFNWKKPLALTRLNLFPNDTPGIFDVYEDTAHDFLFVSSKNQITGWYKGRKKSIRLPVINDPGVQIRSIDLNTLVVTTASHLWMLSSAELFGKDSLTVQDAFMTLPPNLYAVTKVIRDKTGEIWVGTSGYGIRRFNPRINQFHSYLPRTTLSHLYVDQQGRIYGRYQFSYGLIDRKTNRLVPFLDESLPEADRRQRYFMQDRQGFFWVSNTHFQTHEQTLFKFSSNWRLLKKYPLPAGVEFGLWANHTLEAPDGYLWIGAKNGKLLQFDPKSGTFKTFSYLKQTNSDTETYALLREPDGTFWIGTQQGLIKAEHLPEKPTYTYYKNSTTSRQSLSNDFVLSLANDPYEPARYLWIGTKGGGLERLDKQTGQFSHFTEAQGLPNKVVYGILVDEFRNLWLSTNRGLAQFNPKNGHFRNYTQADGLQDNEFNTSSFFKSPSGELLFGGINGLNIFRPSELAKGTLKPPVANLLGLRINNKPVEVRGSDEVLSQGIEYTQELNLRHDQNLLTFEFGVMDYTNPANNQYRYRLHGIDDDWVEAGTNRFANYAQLPDGSYTLEFIGSADGQVWSKPVTLQVRVHPPFYRSWWAYLLYAIALGLIGWQLYRFQKQRWQLQQQVAIEQEEARRFAELDILKTQFFTNISHEFRTPLTLILGPMEQLARDYATDDRFPMIQRNASRLLALINQLLDLSKLEVGQLKPEFEAGDIAIFFRTLAGSFSSLAESRGIAFAFTQQKPTLWVRFDRDKLEKIVTNLLSNAFKFTSSGDSVVMRVAYRLEASALKLIIEVEDTGIGIAAKDLDRIFERFYQRSEDAVTGKGNRIYEGTGIGLALVKELVNVFEGTIDVRSSEGIGTTFTVVIPMLVVEAPIHSSAEALRQNEEARPKNGLIPQIGQTASSVLSTETENVLLIIDDNTDIRAYIRSIFQAEYQIVEAVDGQEGLEKATDLMPDVVICDLMMPRLDGFGFCRALKTQQATSHIPVVMLTAKAAIDDRIEGFELGADEYLTKPFNRDEIVVRVRNLIQQRQRLYEWFATRLPSTTTVAVPVPLTVEHKFVERLTEIVIEHLDDTSFSVEMLAEAANLSRSQLHRKLKALTNDTATTFIREVRLTKAAELLTGGEHSVTQVAYAVGFDNPSYFAKTFQERFGCLPSQYRKSTEATG